MFTLKKSKINKFTHKILFSVLKNFKLLLILQHNGFEKYVYKNLQLCFLMVIKHQPLYPLQQ